MRSRTLADRLKTLAAAMLATALAAAPALADATLDKIRQRGVVVVGVSVSGAPFGSIDPVTRENVGYNVELAQSVGKHLGVAVETVSVTPGNRVQFLQQGRVDLLIANMQFTEERDQILSYVPTAYDVVGGAALVKKSSNFKDFADLKGLPVCLSQGSNYAKPLSEVYGAEPKGLKNTAESVLALRGGNCVAAVHDGPSLHYLLKSPEWQDYTLLPGLLIPLPSVIWVRRGESDTQAALDAVARDWYRTGELVAIAEKNGVPTDEVLKLRAKYLGQ